MFFCLFFSAVRRKQNDDSDDSRETQGLMDLSTFAFPISLFSISETSFEIVRDRSSSLDRSQSREPDCFVMDRFRIVQTIGRGAFGSVSEAEERRTKKRFALKRVFLRDVNEGGRRTMMREVMSMRQIDHPNVLRLVDVFPDDLSLVLVMPMMECDLRSFLNGLTEPPPESIVKSYALMLLRGIFHIHQHGMLHRDIKPSNMLIARDGTLKIGDFGLARIESASGAYTPNVSTRWYRAPELLFGAASYGRGVDLWACGCVWAEMIALTPLFKGENDIDQLCRIFQYLGNPSVARWPEVKTLPDFAKIEFPTMRALKWSEILPGASERAQSAVSMLLKLNPARRASAMDVILSGYFHEEPLPTRKLPIPRRSSPGT